MRKIDFPVFAFFWLLQFTQKKLAESAGYWVCFTAISGGVSQPVFHTRAWRHCSPGPSHSAHASVWSLESKDTVVRYRWYWWRWFNRCERRSGQDVLCDVPRILHIWAHSHRWYARISETSLGASCGTRIRSLLTMTRSQMMMPVLIKLCCCLFCSCQHCVRCCAASFAVLGPKSPMWSILCGGL